MLTLSGCGGADVEYQEVPGGPVEITLPEGQPAEDAAAEGDVAAPEGTAEDEASAAEPTPTETAPADAGATGAADQPTTEAQAPATAAEDGPESDQPPVPGSDAERFEDFCEQNAGAC